jgi:hypothetical protein
MFSKTAIQKLNPKTISKRSTLIIETFLLIP